MIRYLNKGKNLEKKEGKSSIPICRQLKMFIALAEGRNIKQQLNCSCQRIVNKTLVHHIKVKIFEFGFIL